MLDALQLRKTRHFLHFVLSVLFFPWLLVWCVCHFSNRSHNQRAQLAMMQMMHNRGSSQ